ncbi:Cholesterol 25-hydroxylase-like protein [Aphelenchoides bicaudatus]|nr:Cholesterol 25-hydroxylase-like protein [Aphelenchoides bicaudatus]
MENLTVEVGSVLKSLVSQNATHGALQPFWDYLRFNYGHIMRSPLFPPFFALSIDYLWVLVFTTIDLFLYNIPFFAKAKIQKNMRVTWDVVKESLYLQMFNQLLWIYPMALVQLIWVPDQELPELAPSLWEFCWQIFFFFVAFDAAYFAFHLTMHKVKFLYRWCHSVHHMYSSPFAAAAQHLHPFELFYVATFITCFPWVLDTHCMTYWGWFVVAQSVSYEVHIGYDLPFMPHRWLPFYAGAPAHDMQVYLIIFNPQFVLEHHVRPLTCFEPWFNYLDRLFGYSISYDQLKKMNKEKFERYGRYNDGEEVGLKKIN